MTANSGFPPLSNPSERPDNGRRPPASSLACQNSPVGTDLGSYWLPSGECRLSMPNERAAIVHVDRRVALGGLVAAALSGRGLAQRIVEPPETGPLSPRAVGELLAQYKVPGASLAIIDQGELTTSYCYGMAQADRPVAASTRFQAASISKTINALAIMKLMALGRIELNDPVNKHLVSWKLPDNALTEKTTVTVGMLLIHTGGPKS